MNKKINKNVGSRAESRLGRVGKGQHAARSRVRATIDESEIRECEVGEDVEFWLRSTRKDDVRLHSVLELIDLLEDEGISADCFVLTLLLQDMGYVSKRMKATYKSKGLLYVVEREDGIDGDTGEWHFTREPFFTDRGLRLFAKLMKDYYHE